MRISNCSPPDIFISSNQPLFKRSDRAANEGELKENEITCRTKNSTQVYSQKSSTEFTTKEKDNFGITSRPFSFECLRLVLGPLCSKAIETSFSSANAKGSPEPSSSLSGNELMPFEEMKSVLGRNENIFNKPLDREGLEKLWDSHETPSDTPKASSVLLRNPGYYNALDQAKVRKG